MKKVISLLIVIMLLVTPVYASAYSISIIIPTGHGSVKVDKESAEEGEKVLITDIPDEGYEMSWGVVLDDKNNNQWLTSDKHNEYTFVMPKSNVRVISQFTVIGEYTGIVIGPDSKPTPPPVDPDTGYNDVNKNSWYYNAVKYVTDIGLMSGIGEERFNPSGKLTRSQVAQILYNEGGKQPVEWKDLYKDVKDENWYSKAVIWCTLQGLVSGYGNNRFGPEDNITREQLVVMLWRKAGSPKVKTDLSTYGDVSKISEYAIDAINWAVASGIISGSGGNLNPRGTATRAEAAQIFMNLNK